MKSAPEKKAEKKAKDDRKSYPLRLPKATLKALKHRRPASRSSWRAWWKPT